jgi:hypothetical protein
MWWDYTRGGGLYSEVYGIAPGTLTDHSSFPCTRWEMPILIAAVDRKADSVMLYLFVFLIDVVSFPHSMKTVIVVRMEV